MSIFANSPSSSLSRREDIGRWSGTGLLTLALCVHTLSREHYSARSFGNLDTAARKAVEEILAVRVT